jgi:phospholipase C
LTLLGPGYSRSLLKTSEPALAELEHVVVLAFENRSFDHMVGFLRDAEYPIDGLTGEEFNLEQPDDPSSVRVPVSRAAPTGPDLSPSPNHDVRDVTVQLYGSAVIPADPGAAHNNGFVFDYAQITGNAGPPAHRVMRCFDPANLPVLSTLAQEFALCDRWYSSVPGPTWPNRFFLHAATSGGYVDNNPRDYTMRTIFQNLEDSGRSWKIYFHDVPQALGLTALRGSIEHFRLFDEEFADDCANGTLPNYAFIEPRYFDFLWLKANDQHPPHSVLPGEHLLADVYERLRASPLWNKTVLVVTWDEHGGTYDHVLPPPTVNPDGKSTPEFAFDRLGPRVPAIVVSPFVARGTIDHTVYEHASVPAFLKRVFNLPNFLTARDAAANTFASALSLAAPRTDTPERLNRPAGGAPLLPVGRGLRELSSEVVLAAKAAGEPSTALPTDLQTSMVALAHSLVEADTSLLRVARLAARTATEHDAAVHVLGAAARFLGL